MAPWYQHHFNDDYPLLYESRTQEQANQEVEFCASILGVTRGETLLDLCCGHGRHLAAFRHRGITAYGVDLSLALITRAAERGLAVARADMRHLPFVSGTKDTGFDHLTCLFTSFGYFDDDENDAALSEMSRVLRRAGRFLLDVPNAEYLVPRLVARSEREIDGYSILEERSYDSQRARVEKRIIMAPTSASEPPREYHESVRLYESADLQRRLQRASLQTERLFGDFDGQPLSPQSPRMILTGFKE